MEEFLKKELETKLAEVEASLLDLQARWPAHSVKPALLAELEELEDERERLQRVLQLE